MDTRNVTFSSPILKYFENMESELQIAEKSVTMNGLHYTFIITHLSLHISNDSNLLSSTDKVRRQNSDTKRLFIGEKARAKQE